MGRYTSIYGTISRKEWWLRYVLPSVLVCVPLLFLARGHPSEDLQFLLFLAGAFFWVATLAGGAKRARAMGRPPWMTLGMLLPGVGILFVLYFGVGADAPKAARVAEPSN